MGQNSLRTNGLNMGKSLERLSTGLRVNRASDDAAGLSVSEQMRTQIRGTAMAKRNAQDATALLQIAEGAMNEIQSVLQRGREISVQAANDTLTETDRGYLQQEVDALLSELNRINDSTQYNGKQILSGGVDSELADSITEGLQGGWLAAAEALISTRYGISGDGRNLNISIESNGAGGTAAYVSAAYGADGRAVGDIDLVIDADDFEPGYDAATNPSGGTAPYYADRIIAHEMVHAIMAVTTGNTNSPTWFAEGAAELLTGAEERLWGSINGNKTNTQALIDANPLSSGWNGTSDAYSVAYLGARYLDEQATGGMSAILQGLDDGTYTSLDDAIASTTSFTGLSDFENTFNASAGQIYIDAETNIDGTGTGAIDNENATADAVVPNNTGSGSEDELTGFVEVYEETSEPLQFQIGANEVEGTDTIASTLSSVSAEALAISEANVESGLAAIASITLFDSAISAVSQKRSDVGALINRLDHAMSNLDNQNYNTQDAESRIRDLDFSEETTEFTKNQILTQSATSMLSQANGNKSQLLSLLG